MPEPHFWIIAGPNGAGKTTLVRDGALAAALSSCEFINPDALTLEYLKEQGISTWAEAETKPDQLKDTFLRAAADSQKLLEQRIAEGGHVAVESVLSTKKYCVLVERVHKAGGRFMLVYVMLHSPHLSRVRINQRSLEGGHDVPSHKLESRWKASLELLPWFANRADQFWIMDNSEAAAGGAGRLVFTGSRHQIRLHGVPASPTRRVASEILTQHSRQAPKGQWRVDLDDSNQTFHI
ncbi:MAG TPA: hypothetical protein DIT13_12370 [Verrucomicrobiales bacterium]|nr:hypothetical protein [Verrucomicrobiales bacterium]HRJ09574.1 zeta toxin family protein [Prosthecobacter sp.]HRK13822.1 zeta toxin family protein [Prosthecobacter sp.]